MVFPVDAGLRLLGQADGHRLGTPTTSRQCWAELMKRLGYARYVAQGGDWGSPVSSAMARQAPERPAGHSYQLAGDRAARGCRQCSASGGPPPAGLSEKESATFDAFSADGENGEPVLRCDHGDAAA